MRRRQRSAITGPNGALLEYPLSTARFIAPLRNTLAPSAGYGPATFTRTTTASFFDNEGMLKEVRAGGARFTGARRVANQFSFSEDLTPSYWIKSNASCSVDTAIDLPPGCETVTRILENTATSSHFVYLPSAWQSGRNMVLTCYAKKGTATKISLNNASAGAGIFFDLDAGTIEGNQAGYPGTITTIGNGWYKLTLSPTSTGTQSLSIGIYRTFTGVWGTDSTYTGTSQFLYVTGLQLEDVTGQSDQTASEYVHSGRVSPNYLTYTDDFTASVWSNINITVTQNSIANPIDGRVNATELQATSTSATLMSQNVVATGSTQTLSFYMKQGSGVAEANSFGIYNLTTLNWVVKASLNYSTKVVTISNGSATINVTDVGSGWLLVSVTVSGVTIGNSLSTRIGFVNNSETSGVFCYVYGPSLVIDSSSTSYTPVGAAYDPHGSGVDGVKYFNTNKDGTPISSGYLKGYLNEGARTNNLRWCRDLTNAAWVKTTMTTALTSTGLDGQASSATRLTATAGNATCLQTFTMASATRTFSAYVKRITGTGTVNITRDNGTNWTDITALLSTSAYTRVNILGTSVTNPTCGFRIVTNGDAIDVDYCQDEAGSFPSNPIATTTVSVTRNSETLSYPMAGNLNNPTGTLLLSQRIAHANNTGTIRAIATAVNISPLYKGSVGTILFSADGTTGVGNIPWATDTTVHNACIAWNTNSRSLSLNGSSVDTNNSYDGSWDGFSFYIGSSVIGTENVFGNVSNIYLWPSALSGINLRQITA